MLLLYCLTLQNFLSAEASPISCQAKRAATFLGMQAALRERTPHALRCSEEVLWYKDGCQDDEQRQQYLQQLEGWIAGCGCLLRPDCADARLVQVRDIAALQQHMLYKLRCRKNPCNS